MTDFVEHDDYGESASSHTVSARKIITGLRAADFRKLAAAKEITTDYTAAAYTHRVTEVVDGVVCATTEQPFTPEQTQCIDDAYRSLASRTLLQVDLRVGRGSAARHARLYLPAHHADLAYLAARSFDQIEAGKADHGTPDSTTIVLPEWSAMPVDDQDRCVLVNSDEATTYILGSDFYGEIRDAILRMDLLGARRDGRLGLVGATKDVWARSYATGDIVQRGLLFIGPAVTGKTALVCHEHDLDTGGGEKIRPLADGVVVLDAGGAVRGTEGRGWMLRTVALNPEDEPSLFDACSTHDAVLENVWMGCDRTVDYYDTTLTDNGRAVVPIARLLHADGEIDLAQCHHVFFLTRNPVMPPVVKLTPAQAAAFYVLGESLPMRADDSDADEPLERRVGASDLPVGPRDGEGNLLYDWLTKNEGITAYVLNTGGVGHGDDAHEVKLEDTAIIIREICRDGVQWQRHDERDFEVPMTVPGVDLEPLRVENRFDAENLEQRLAALKEERERWLEQFTDIHDEIRSAAFA